MKISESSTSKTTWSYFAEKDHPLWGILKLLITGCSVALLLSFNATSFDSGEVRTVIGTLVATFILEGFNIRRKRKGED